MNKPNRDKSHSEMMNEWAAQRSFINQMRSRIFFPPYDSPWYGKVWGYLWRLTFVVAMVVLLSYVFLRTRLRTESFRSYLAEEISQRYKATNVTCGKTVASLWSNECTINALGADGAPGSFFNRLDAHQISFDLSGQMLRTDWHLAKVSFGELNLNLRSGTYDPSATAPASTPAAPSQPDRVVPNLRTSGLDHRSNLLTAGFGVRPKLSELKIDSYEVKNLGLRWGYSETTAGKLSDANVSLEPTARNGWAFMASSGELTQNWLSGMKVQKLDVTVEDTMEIKRAIFTRGPGEVIELAGAMSLGDLPELNLTIAGRGVNLKTLTPPAFSSYFDALADVSGTMTGTINRASGVKIQLRVKLVPPAREGSTKGAEKPTGVAWLKNVPLFRSLYVASGADALVQPVVSEGAFNLETSEGVMKISDLDLVCGDLLRIRGEIQCSEATQAAKMVEGVQSVATTTYALRTNLLIGLKSSLVAVMPKNIRETYFTQEAEGMQWLPLKLVGEEGATLTKALAEEISRLHKESLIEKVR